MRVLPEDKRRILLTEHTSHANKMAFMVEYLLRGFFVETGWMGDVKKRARFRFEPDGPWQVAKDYLSDVVSKYKETGE